MVDNIMNVYHSSVKTQTATYRNVNINLGPDFRQAQRCDRAKPINGIPTLPFLSPDLMQTNTF